LLPYLVAEATRRSALVWIEVPGSPARAAWHVWHDGAAYVVSGEGEQPLPELEGATTAAVHVRSADKLGRLLTWQAEVRRLEPDSELWQAVVPLLLAARLNLPDSADAEQRWGRRCTVHQLSPVDGAVTAGADLPQESLAAPPRPSPATTATPLPFTLTRRGRRARQRRRA